MIWLIAYFAVGVLLNAYFCKLVRPAPDQYWEVGLSVLVWPLWLIVPVFF